MEKPRKVYHRIISIFLMVIIISMVVINFIFKENLDITWEIIICFALLIILGLSEIFDSLSIPKVISLSKNVEKKEKENKELQEINLKLIQQITSIKNSNNQNLYNIISKESSNDIKDMEKDLKNNDLNLNEIDVEPKKNNKTYTWNMKLRYRSSLELTVLKKVLKDKENPQYSVVLTNNELSENRIMKDEVRFDACVYENGENIFYEVYVNRYLLDYNQKLFSILQMVDFYQKFTDVPAKLILVIPKMDDALQELLWEQNNKSIIERINKKFAPAIKNSLLEIMEVDVSKQEVDEMLKNKRTDKK